MEATIPETPMIVQVLATWARLQSSQWLSKEKMRQIQAKRLRRIVNHAYRNVPFYRELYRRARLDVSLVKDTSDLAKIPAITKQQFIDTPLQHRTAAGIDVSSCASVTTSGSTGRPVTIMEDPYSTAYREALNLRFLWAYGVRPRHKICRVRVRGSEVKVSLDRRGLYGVVKQRRIRDLWFGGVDFNDQIKFFLKWKPDVVIGPPSYFRALMRFSESVEKHVTFKVIVSSLEMLDETTRKLIGDRLQAEVFDHYSTDETGPIAWECPTHDGLHINNDSAIVEFLHDQKPVSAGFEGEVTVTCFHRIATPIIRYSVGDVAMAKKTECTCGRGLQLMTYVQGRVLDCILTKDGAYISPHSVMAAFEIIPHVEQYKVIQKEDFSIKAYIKGADESVNQVVLDAKRVCADLFGKMDVDIESVDEINAPPDRKFRFVESYVMRS